MLGPFFVEKTAFEAGEEGSWEYGQGVIATLDVWDPTFTGWWLMMVNDG